MVGGAFVRADNIVSDTYNVVNARVVTIFSEISKNRLQKPQKNALCRRRALDARERILEAAQQMLKQMSGRKESAFRGRESGGRVAPAHSPSRFKNRAGLVAAVVTRAITALESDVISALSAGAMAAPENPYTIIEGAFRAMNDQGHGRLLAWLALSGEAEGQAASKIADIARAVHELRKTTLEARGEIAPPFEDTANVVTLASYALFADAICGKTTRKMMPHTKKDPSGEKIPTMAHRSIDGVSRHGRRGLIAQSSRRGD